MGAQSEVRKYASKRGNETFPAMTLTSYHKSPTSKTVHKTITDVSTTLPQK